MARHTMRSLGRSILQAVLGDNTESDLESLADEVKKEARKDMGEFQSDAGGTTVVITEGEDKSELPPKATE